jgi:hydroxymethylpyrimidine/phosphomethylpyrimidine kinase
MWQCDRDLAAACLAHPFVRGLADGSLPPWRYRDYVAQDAFFLRAFAAAYALAGARCADADGRALYQRLAQGVDEELQLHRRQAERLGLDLARVQASDATLAYTEFLTATAATRPEPCAAAAMLPCLRLYAWLGQQLLPALSPDSPYADWVRTYADAGFDQLWRALAPRLDAAAAHGVDADELAALHRRAMHLEHRFFAAAWGGDAPGRPRVALTIAGSDPSGGAGIQADLKTFCRHGVYGQSVVTLLTAQNTRGVQGVFPLPADIVLAQLRSVADDLGAHAAKTGALGSAALVEAVAGALASRPFGALVVDPVLVSKHGHALADAATASALRARLLPLADVVTPNRHEAEAIVGVRVVDEASARAAAQAILACGAKAVVVKDVPGLAGDLLAQSGGEAIVSPSPRLATPHRHGSGCTFSAALTARLAHGDDVPTAVRRATDFTSRAIASAPGFGAVGPLNHFA